MNETIQKAKALFAPVPRVQLGFFPTPFYKLERMSKELGVNLYIKRDDFTGMNLFGGNKTRKLEFLIGKALQDGCDRLIVVLTRERSYIKQEEKALDLPHRLVLEGRSKLAVNGITEIESFDENTIVMETSQGTLVVSGQGLHIEKLSLDGGDLKVEGTIDTLSYEESRRERGGLFSRLLG